MVAGKAPGRYLFDLHVHSTGSADSSLSPAAAITRARELCLRGLAFTDHDRLTLLDSPFDDLILVPGAELSTEWGDLLAIGISELPPSGRSVLELVDEIHRQGAVAVVPHPFSEELRRICMNERVLDIIGVIDALEVTSPKRSVDNSRARKVARDHHKAVTGGSDAHTVEGMGRGFTACEEGTVDGLVEAIRRGKTRAFMRK